MPAIIATPRLRLRAPNAGDAGAIFVYAADPRVTRYLVWPTAESMDHVEDFLDDAAWGWADGSDFCYALIRRSDDALVGMGNIQFDDSGAELGYLVTHEARGQGLATEAAAALLVEAAKIDDLWRIWATCDPDNTASIKVLEKIGMACEGRLRRRSPRPNRADVQGPQDDLIFAWTRDDPLPVAAAEHAT